MKGLHRGHESKVAVGHEVTPPKRRVIDQQEVKVVHKSEGSAVARWRRHEVADLYVMHGKPEAGRIEQRLGGVGKHDCGDRDRNALSWMAGRRHEL
ncbi:hypothetical protein GCM10022278_37410 [Allohahella marinimesophila]|uniref:Transposase n=1 Tax=Allohahella marinimesophila TaxID=1054972 RepID=A0ABP7Q7D5_9GAMM